VLQKCTWKTETLYEYGLNFFHLRYLNSYNMIWFEHWFEHAVTLQ